MDAILSLKEKAATLSLWFLQNNGILYRPDGAKRIADGTRTLRD